MRIYSLDIGMEFGIEKSIKLIMKSRKRQITEGMELSNQVKIKTPREKETYKYLGILAADTIKQVEMKKSKKDISGKRESYSKPNHIAEPHQKDKCLGYPPRKILGAILNVDQRRTSTIGPENKRTNDYV